MPRLDMRRQRGRRTRQRLTASALKLFGARGFKATTTLAIAGAARANQASIRYHFGGKRELYLAVAHLIATEGSRAMHSLLERSRKQVDRGDDARALLSAIMQEFARQLCKYSDQGAAASFLARELGSPGVGYTTIYEGYVRDVHLEATSLLARATKRFRRAQSAIIDAHALVGAVLGFVAARKAFKQRSGRSTNSDERIEAICERIAEATAGMTECGRNPRPTRAKPSSRLRSSRSRPSGSRTPAPKGLDHATDQPSRTYAESPMTIAPMQADTPYTPA